MKHLKRNIRGASMVLLSLFMLLTAYFYYNLFLYSDRWFSNPNNARVRVDMDNPILYPAALWTEIRPYLWKLSLLLKKTVP